jgi:hypothetical protein
VLVTAPSYSQAGGVLRTYFGQEWGELVFTAEVIPGSRAIKTVDLWFATQIDTLPQTADDFASIPLESNGSVYVGRLAVGTPPPRGAAATRDNILFFVSVSDEGDFTISSKMHYKTGEMKFCSGFDPSIEHFPRDSFVLPPPPSPNCSCAAATTGATP